MSSLLELGIVDLAPERGDGRVACGCSDARRGCMPTFVFSVAGQVAFRTALRHLIQCRKLSCMRLRRMVREAMRKKLQRLFNETIILGCVHIQATLYGGRSVRLRPDNFSAVAHHLAHCPKESCAQLRRSLLLTVRDTVSPNAQSS